MAQKKVVNDATIEQDARNTGREIAKEPKVTVMIAPDEKNPTWRGWINGYKYEFPKGRLIDVPKSVAKVIENSTRMSYAKQKMEEALVRGLNA